MLTILGFIIGFIVIRAILNSSKPSAPTRLDQTCKQHDWRYELDSVGEESRLKCTTCGRYPGEA